MLYCNVFIGHPLGDNPTIGGWSWGIGKENRQKRNAHWPFWGLILLRVGWRKSREIPHQVNFDEYPAMNPPEGEFWHSWQEEMNDMKATNGWTYVWYNWWLSTVSRILLEGTWVWELISLRQTNELIFSHSELGKFLSNRKSLCDKYWMGKS